MAGANHAIKIARAPERAPGATFWPDPCPERTVDAGPEARKHKRGLEATHLNDRERSNLPAL